MSTLSTPCPPIRRVRDDLAAEARAMHLLNRRLRLFTFSIPLVVLAFVGYQAVSHLREAVGALVFTR